MAVVSRIGSSSRHLEKKEINVPMAMAGAYGILRASGLASVSLG
jgi:hypothetical protein